MTRADFFRERERARNRAGYWRDFGRYYQPSDAAWIPFIRMPPLVGVLYLWCQERR
jgi:hypothetical protein